MADLGPASLRVRTVDPTPSVWVVAAAAAPEGAEPDASADAELLDRAKRETAIGDNSGATRVFARVRGRGMVTRLIATARMEGLR